MMPKKLLLSSLISSALLALSACGSDGGSGDTESNNQKPSAVIAQPSSTTIAIGQELKLDGIQSKDDDGTIEYYLWEVDGEGQNKTQSAASFDFDKAGQYTITLTVTDDDGASHQDSIKITVTDPQLPEAKITWQTAAVIDKETLFSAEESTGDISAYEWSLNGKVVGSEKTLSYRFTETGQQKLSLKVSYKDETSDSTSLSFNVLGKDEKLPPKAVIDGATSGSYETGSSLTLSAKNSTDIDGEIVSYQWIIGEQTFNTKEITKIFETRGKVNIALIVTDNDGKTDRAEIEINVESVGDNQSPVANIDVSSPLYLELGAKQVFDASDSYDPDGQFSDLSFIWDSGESTATINKTFDTEGVEKICVEVLDLMQAKAKKCVSVVISAPATSTIVYLKDNQYTHIHYWDVAPERAETDWPGVAMTTLNDGWLAFDFDDFIDSSKVIFTDGAESTEVKTKDLDFDPAKPCYQEGIWVDMAACEVNGSIDVLAPIVSASPKAGNYEDDSLSVSLEFDDKDSATVIYYTLDGSKPSSSSTVYKSAIDISDEGDEQVDAIIKAIAIDSSDNESELYTFEYKLNEDATAPTLSILPAVGPSIDPISVVLSAEDNQDSLVKVHYTLDGSEPSANSPEYDKALDISESTTIKVYAVDAAGNEATGSYFYRIGAAPERNDFREETIYFAMTARFFDGDSDNNRYTRAAQETGNLAGNDPAWRGDLMGVTQKLDYLKALGFTAIWITPPVLNRSDYDFHGYHAWDFDKIDGRIGGDDAFKELIDEAHKRDMKIIMDIVLNHTSRYGAVGIQTVKYYGTQDDDWSWYYNDHNPNFEYDGLSIEPNSGVNYYNGDVWTSDKPTLAWSDLPGWGEKTELNHKTQRMNWMYQWTDLTLFDPELFHESWLGNWEDETAQSGTIHEDLPDLNTENKQVQDYLIKTYCKYIDWGVDAFRIDTVKHVSRVMFNRRYIPAFKDCGGDNFYMFGEVATRVNEVWNKGNAPLSTPFYTWAERKEFSEDDELAVHEGYEYEFGMGTDNQPTSDNHYLDGNDYHEPDYTQSSGMSVIDFPMHWNFDNAGQAFNIARHDHVYNDATWNVVYVDSHDYGPNRDNRYDGDEATWAENMSYMWTFRGIPTLYYGSEVRFKSGAPADVGMTGPLEGTGRAYFGDHIEGSVEVSDFGEWDNATGNMADTLNSPLAQHLSHLNKIRRQIPAIQKGQYSTDDVSGFAYKRRFVDVENGIDSFALIALSGGATFDKVPNGIYVDAVTGDRQTVSSGSLTASASGKGNLRVYVLELPGNPAPGKIEGDSPFLK